MRFKWISQKTQDILDRVEEYRKAYGYGKDEKITPLTEYEVNQLPDLPETWSWVTSNDISTFITNGVHSPTSRIDELGINKRMLRITDIDDSNTADFQNLPYCTRFVKGDYDKTLKKNDIYISFTGAKLGKRYLVKEDDDDIVFAHYFVRWQPIVVNPKYIYYVLLSHHFERFMYEHTLGSSQPNLKVTDLKRVPLPLAPLDEQDRIVSLLAPLDAKIDLLRRQNHTLEQIAQTLFKRWFVEFEFPVPFDKLREHSSAELAEAEHGQPYRTSGGPMQPSELGEIPLGWRVGMSGDVVEITSSKRIFRSEYQETGVLFYRSKEIIELASGNEISTPLYISEDRFNELTNKFGAPTEGDILLTSVGTIGIPYLVQKNDVFYFKDGNLTWFKNFKDGFNGQFIYYWLKSASTQQQITEVTIGSTQKALTIQALKGLIFCIPQAQILQEFTNLLEQIVRKTNNNTQQIRTLTRLRDTLLPKLMSGKLRVNSE